MTCSTFLQPYIDWVKDSGNPLVVKAVANRSDSSFCFYLEGVLVNYDGTRLTGPGYQYFSDRRFGDLNFERVIGLLGNPFNPEEIDRVELELVIPNGPLTFTLQSWGNVQITYAVECRNGLLIGTTGDTIVLLSFLMAYQP